MPVSIEATSRLNHIKLHLDGGYDLEKLTECVEHNKGDPVACAMRLSSHAFAKGMHAWFELADLTSTKSWFTTSGFLSQYAFSKEVDKMNLLHKTLDFMKALVFDNEELISWYCSFSDIRDSKRIESVTTADFTAYQVILSVLGDWDTVLKRCKLLDQKPPKGDAKRYLLDNQFFQALASGDESGMKRVITELVSPKLIKARSSCEGGYSQGLISTFAVIYSKLAWRHGFKIEVESPYIPAAWLPIAPLAKYDPVYDFLRNK